MKVLVPMAEYRINFSCVSIYGRIKISVFTTNYNLQDRNVIRISLVSDVVVCSSDVHIICLFRVQTNGIVKLHSQCLTWFAMYCLHKNDNSPCLVLFFLHCTRYAFILFSIYFIYSCFVVVRPQQPSG